MKHRISIAVAAVAAITAFTPSADAGPALHTSSVIVGLDTDAEKVRPSQLEEIVRGALETSHAITVSGGEGFGEAAVFDVSAQRWFVDSVRARFGRDSHYRLTEMSGTTVHVTFALPENALSEKRTPARDIAETELRNLLQDPGKKGFAWDRRVSTSFSRNRVQTS